jgi:hypothetical protein
VPPEEGIIVEQEVEPSVNNECLTKDAVLRFVSLWERVAAAHVARTSAQFFMNLGLERPSRRPRVSGHKRKMIDGENWSFHGRAVGAE